MSRLRRATVWLGLVGALCAAAMAVAATVTASGATSSNAPEHSQWAGLDAATWRGDAAIPATPERANTSVADRTDPVRPVLLWWVAAIAALLAAIAIPRRLWSPPSMGARTGTWSRRFDRGPPLGLSIP